MKKIADFYEPSDQLSELVNLEFSRTGPGLQNLPYLCLFNHAVAAWDYEQNSFYQNYSKKTPETVLRYIIDDLLPPRVEVYKNLDLTESFAILYYPKSEERRIYKVLAEEGLQPYQLFELYRKVFLADFWEKSCETCRLLVLCNWIDNIDRYAMSPLKKRGYFEMPARAGVSGGLWKMEKEYMVVAEYNIEGIIFPAVSVSRGLTYEEVADQKYPGSPFGARMTWYRDRGLYRLANWLDSEERCDFCNYQNMGT